MSIIRVNDENIKINCEAAFHKIKLNKIRINPIIINYKTVRLRKPLPVKRRIIKLGGHSNSKSEIAGLRSSVDVEINDVLVDKLFLIKQKCSIKNKI